MKHMARRKPFEKVDPLVEARVMDAIRQDGLPPPPPEKKPRAPARVWSVEEVEAQLEFVYLGFRDGFSAHDMWRAGRGRWPWTRSRVDNLIGRIRDRMASAGRDDREVAIDRQRAVDRMFEAVRYAAGEKDKDGHWVRKPDIKSQVAAERLLADLQGTKAPEKVDVNVRYTHAMLQVMANLEGERGQKLFEMALEQKRLADIARRQLPALVEAEGGE